MKKLNRKGFTLIELLAVIVILAIIVVVTVPTIINTITDARVSSIWNLAGSTANSYDTMAAQDLLASTPTVSDLNVTGSWQCIGNIQNTDGTKKLADVLNLSDNDLVLTGNYPTADTDTAYAAATCSSIRLKGNGAAEVLLVAKDGGKFAVSGKKVWALSSQDAGHQDAVTPGA